ncbi:MAG: DMT family transporter [Clostridiaceae bacterium]
MKNKKVFGHILAIITIIIWGTTFVSTKILLKEFSPEEILIYRFFIAFLILMIIYPKMFKILPIKEEVLFFFLGISGISLYFWTENLALKYTQATNVGLISSAIPILTALISHFIFKDEKFSINFLLGFLLSIIGVVAIVYNGKILKLNPVGDILAVISAFLFAVYSILINKVRKEYSEMFIVRKIFFYGAISMIPIGLFSGVSINKVTHMSISATLNMLYLSLFASVLCFIMWNKAVNIIGTLKTTNYIYFVPIITMGSSAVLLNEKINLIMIIGGLLIFSGVYLNYSKTIRVKRNTISYNQET